MLVTTISSLVPRSKAVHQWQTSGVSFIWTRSLTDRVETHRKRGRYTPDEDDQITKLKQAGYGNIHISKVLGRSPNSVADRWTRYVRFQSCRTIDPRPTPRARDLEIVRMVDVDGLSFAEIARRHGTAQRYNTNLCIVRRAYERACSLNMKTPGHGVRPYSDQEIEAIACGLRNGRTILEIAESLDSPRSSASLADKVRKTEYLRELRRVRSRKKSPALEERDVMFPTMNLSVLPVSQLSKQSAEQLDPPESSIRGHPHQMMASEESAQADRHSNSSAENQTAKSGSDQNVVVMDRFETANVCKRKLWTSEEIQFLTENVGIRNADWDGLSKLMPGRSPAAIRHKYLRLMPNTTGHRRRIKPFRETRPKPNDEKIYSNQTAKYQAA